MAAEFITWIIASIFAVIFGYALFDHLRVRRRDGPPEDPREAFEFDEAAPSYEEPPTDEAEAGDDESAGSESEISSEEEKEKRNDE